MIHISLGITVSQKAHSSPATPQIPPQQVEPTAECGFQVESTHPPQYFLTIYSKHLGFFFFLQKANAAELERPHTVSLQGMNNFTCSKELSVFWVKR